MEKIPQTPRSSEEIAREEGLTPEMREGYKKGLMPTMDEILEDLETRATDLPEKIMKVNFDKKETASNQENFYLLREKYTELAEEYKKSLTCYVELIKASPSIRSERFAQRLNHLSESIDLIVVGFSGDMSAYLRLQIQSIEFMINILKEEIELMKNKSGDK